MPFKVKGRILLELGSELISSDAIALFELIKNSIDAGARKTILRVGVTLQHSRYVRLRNLLSRTGGDSVAREDILEEVKSSLEASAPEERRSEMLNALRNAQNQTQFRAALDDAYVQGNAIEVVDNGHGMSLLELNDVYLTIGTPARLLEKRFLFERFADSDDAPRPPLGEKGIGRLAAMRLGDRLEVKTARREDRQWNMLSVDWSVLRDAKLDLEALPAEPKHGDVKERKDESGTSIRIMGLTSDWSKEKLQQLAKTEFAKLFDPLTPGRRDNIELNFNNVEVITPAFDPAKLKFADAVCRGEFRMLEGVPTLSGSVEYSLHARNKVFKVYGVHLESAVKAAPGRPNRKVRLIPNSEAVVDALATVGPFEFEFHWFNRGRLMREQPDIWGQIRDFVTLWSGGLLVYRDGCRVFPYGASDDDWLDLDRKALASGAYKFNRAQIIGRVKITSRRNPRLQDQTNREGFRECPEKQVLVRLMRHVIISEVRSFLEDVNDAVISVDRDDLENIERRLESSQIEAVRRIRDIGKRVPEERQTVTQLLDYLRDVSLAWERAKELAKSYETDLEKYIHLAGVGLMVEFIAHELTRATHNALETLEHASGCAPPNMETLRAQLKTIEKRLRILDPVSTPGRQRRKEQDVRSIFEEVRDAHTAQLERHSITIKCLPKALEKFTARVEKGQMIQILENLIANAVYWLRAKHMREEFDPELSVRFDSGNRRIIFMDNGPGIPEERGEEVFTPFFTTKPPGEGRGLGLYIASKLAEYNEASLTLAAPRNGVHNGFVLAFREPKG